MTLRAFCGIIVGIGFGILVRWAYLEMGRNPYPKSAIGLGFMICFIFLTALAVIYVFIEVRAALKSSKSEAIEQNS